MPVEQGISHSLSFRQKAGRIWFKPSDPYALRCHGLHHLRQCVAAFLHCVKDFGQQGNVDGIGYIAGRHGKGYRRNIQNFHLLTRIGIIGISERDSDSTLMVTEIGKKSKGLPDPFFRRRHQLVQQGGNDAQHHDGRDHQGHLEGLGAIGDQIPQAGLAG